MALHFTYDPSTVIGITRFRMGDTDISNANDAMPRSQWSCAFADEEILVLLNDWGNDTNRAAIMGLRIAAANPDLQGHSLSMLNFSMDLGDIPGALERLADDTQQSRTHFPWEEMAEVGYTDANIRKIIVNRIQRRGSSI